MLSVEEVRSQCLDAMGQKLGAMYCDLNDHLLDVLLLWKQYEQLFGVNQETVQVLNISAPTFFGVIQAQLWDAVMLGMSRLTDSPNNAQQKNLSIRAIPPLIRDLGVRARMNEAVAAALVDTKFARDHRNKRIAHIDLLHVQNRAANPLPSGSRDKIKAGLDSICVALEILNGHYRESTMLYDDLIFDGGAGSVVSLLRGGLKHRECEVDN